MLLQIEYYSIAMWLLEADEQTIQNKVFELLLGKL